MNEPIIKERYSNIEFLRILTMSFIVMYHLCRHGFSAYLNDYTVSVNNIFIKGISQLQGLSNCIFLMISGYFLVDANFAWKKVFKLWFQCFFFSAIIGTVFYVSRIPVLFINGGGFVPLSLFEYKMYLRPIFFNLNWFTTTYILFYILSPFITIMIKNITKNQHIMLIFICLFFGFFLNALDYNPYNFNRLFYFISIYFIASYLKFYSPSFLNSSKKCFFYAISSVFLYFCYVLVIHVWAHKFGISFDEKMKIISKLMGMDHVPMVIISVFIFCGFKNIQMKHNRIINAISSTTLTVYLIHDNFLHRDFLWQRICHLLDFWNSRWFIPYAFLCVIAIFSFGCILELLRKRFVEKYVMKLWDFSYKNILNIRAN